MSTLIVPCAGKSSRFPNMKPKWMLTHPDGKIMLEKAISGLPLNTFDRIIVTIVKQHTKDHEAKTILNQVFGHLKKKFEILELDGFTSSQSETVYQTLVRKRVKGPFIVKDSDNYVHIHAPVQNDFVAGVDITTFPKEITRLKSKSFLIVNEQNILVDIVEKRISSEKICIGVYGFGDPKKFVQAYSALSKDVSRTGEIYLSHIISYLIGTSAAVYSYIEAAAYEDWGTLEDWKLTQERHATYFIDIDGVLLKNKGKYGRENWNNTLLVIEENIALLQKLANSGAQLVLTTCRGENDLTAFKKLLKKRDIAIHSFVTNCHHAPRILINDFAPTNPYPSCRAINVPRNGSLESYL